MTLQIIGAALPRTGTLSLKFALEKLGFGPAYHMTELIAHPEHRWKWAMARWRIAALDPIWREYASTVDAPGCMLWRKLAKRYPEAKVILTRRDPGDWVDSVQSTVGNPDHAKVILKSPLLPALLPLNPFGMSRKREKMIAHFERYGDEVRAAIPAERLLEYRAGDGWEPLCRFLGVPVPDLPYPHANTRRSMQDAQGEDIGEIDFAEAQSRVRSFVEKEAQSFAER